MIDLQINGLTVKNKFSCNFWNYPSHQDIQQLCQHLFLKGTEQFLATLITDSIESLLKNLEIIQQYKQLRQNNLDKAIANNESYIAGVHIEGGLISRLGIHPEKYSKELNLNNSKLIINKYPKLIKLWTLCPLIDRDSSVTHYLQDAGVHVSYGHSMADYETSQNNFDKNQVKLVTHFANAMNVFKNFEQRQTTAEMIENLENPKLIESISPKDIGLGYVAFHNPDITTMMIIGHIKNNDLHISKELALSLAKKKPKNCILTSDAVSKVANRSKLEGGQTSLEIHCDNARNIGLNDNFIQQSAYFNPKELLN